MKKFSFALVFLLMGCTGFESPDSHVHQVNSLFQNDQTLESRSIKDCRSINYSVLSSIFKDIFLLPEGDLQQRDSDGNPVSDKQRCGGPCYYIEHNSILLSDSKVSTQVAHDSSCNSNKFKLYFEIFAHGCSEALKNPNVVEKLFPQGKKNYDTLYEIFLSRKPNTKEIAILAELTAKFSSDKATTALCMAVASSLEATTI